MTEAKTQLDAWMTEAWIRKLERTPLLKQKNGLFVVRLPKGTLEEAEEDQAFALRCLQRLREISLSDLSEEDLLTHGFLQEYLLQESHKTDIWWATFPVTPYHLFWVSAYPEELFQPFLFDEESDTATYEGLLQDFADAISSILTKLKMQAARGWYIPKPALPEILKILHHLRETVPEKLKVSATRLQSVASARSQLFLKWIDQMIEKQIHPAFEALLAYLESPFYQDASPVQVGMAQYPGGEEAYRLLVRLNVTFDITPEEIHEIGLKEVGKLTEEMKKVREQLGFSGSEEDFIQHVKERGKLHAATPEEVEQRYKYHLERIAPLMKDYFSAIPKAAYQVKRLDPAFEASVAYGYFSPSSDTQPIGTYYYNGSNLDKRSQLQAAALIFHEIIPGHHLQFAIQHENKQLPKLQRESMEITGYIEGWAEYASGLPYEMGLYDDPYDWYGRLIHERFIAQRLVTDTGMNLFGWSLERARAYMAHTTIESEAQIASETLRYSTESPAQALAYRLGHLKLLELRDTAQRELGPAFDLKEFHHVVLSAGSLPLTVLTDHVQRYISRTRSLA